MKYITLREMNDAIRKNLWKIPRDIDFILGIPRSGVLAGSIIAEHLNCPMTDVDAFCSGAKPTGGARLRYWKPKHATGRKKVLVVDDTVWNGGSKTTARKKLEPYASDYEFIYLVVFLEGPGESSVDIWLEDVRQYTNGFRETVLYEWNIVNHNENTMYASIYDIDGVLCLDPPDERNAVEYQRYIKDATPLFIPTPTVGAIVTYRLSSNAEVTKEWLGRQGVTYRRIEFFPADTWEERHASGISPERYKADYYRNAGWAKLFVESDDAQARKIFEMTGKPVYCVGTNRMYANL